MNKNIYLLLLLVLPLSVFGQLSDSYDEMLSESDPAYEEYEPIILKASEYVFTQPINSRSKEYIAAHRIIEYWKNKDTGMGIPLGNEFYDTLTNEKGLQYYYMISMMQYQLDQKINNNRVLSCIPVPGEIYKDQDDVSEVQLEGAKILLEYISDKLNKVSVNAATKEYVKAYKKGKLKDLFLN
ncbi:hypothetical protein AAU57_06790 [Nonlabens sp. YIK11]|uniref:hypothetical protein n=1 Tax=Nonlabens sp. YIK11 TaxID=1453349 RepID=UPI0006DD1666|nr:hypothetical protein [Nonlabens sp. YIK11]KQC33055.1 hypothetical protein AAU57_06790 [Nonlabens sp. YIK11]